VLGLVQGPTELLPVSSSAHLAMIPRLAGWDWDRLDPELRKSFEVALHAGAAIALLFTRRSEITDEVRSLNGRRIVVLALSFAPAAMIGYRYERTIESKLGGPRSTAAGLIGGAIVMAVADRMPQERGHGEAGAADGLALGVGQAAALMPGVSRNGATLTAARMRGFTRDQANLLSRTVALPVILGAVGLKAARLARRGVTGDQKKWLAIGTATSLVSTLASNGLIRLVERDRALMPYSLYRIAFALLIIARLGGARPAPAEQSVVESTVMKQTETA
jgi:undecaprenyl-diphosphatase